MTDPATSVIAGAAASVIADPPTSVIADPPTSVIADPATSVIADPATSVIAGADPQSIDNIEQAKLLLHQPMGILQGVQRGTGEAKSVLPSIWTRKHLFFCPN
ncbi:MAG: hypothetical protein LBN12_01995 [Clostridiales Family XIII bacterium]|jgi:hypothetical protein|nr:hypothetical protein [Clostridiales Family XIII bacterium]